MSRKSTRTHNSRRFSSLPAQLLLVRLCTRLQCVQPFLHLRALIPAATTHVTGATTHVTGANPPFSLTNQRYSALLKIGLMAVVDFTAQWCGPCKKIKGPFKDMAKANPNVVFLQVWQRMCLNVSSGCRAERARGEKECAS